MNGEEWQTKFIGPLTGGYNVSAPPELIPDIDSPNLDNVRFDRKELVSDYGYAALGGVVDGIPKMTYRFDRMDGTSELLLVTSATLYYWNAGAWQYIQDGDGGTVADGGEPAGEVNIQVIDTSNLAATNPVGLTLDDGSEHQTIISSITSGTIFVIQEGIPVGRTLLDNGRVVKAKEFTTTDADAHPSMTTWSVDDWVIMTNGVDNIQRYDGTDCRDLPGLPSAGNCQASIVRIKDNHVLLLNTIEGGTRYRQRVRNSDTGDPTNWSTGNAGFTDLHGGSDMIVCAEHLGPFLIIYGNNSIERMEYAGTSANLFHFETMVRGEGAVSSRSVLVRINQHFIMGISKFYTYSGGYEVGIFGAKIWERIYEALKTYNSAYGRYVSGAYISSMDECWWLIPTESGAKLDELLRYNVIEDAWSIGHFGDTLACAGCGILYGYFPWNTAVGTWEDWDITWDDPSESGGEECVLLCGYNSQVFKYSHAEDRYNGKYITYTYETGDFFTPGKKIRISCFNIMLKGDWIYLLYSEDEGRTWTCMDSRVGIPDPDTFQLWRVEQSLVVSKIRLQLWGFEKFEARWIAVDFKEEGRW